MLEKLAGKLTPPERNQDPTPWRWKMFGTVLLVAGALSLHIAASHGLIPGMPGVAYADDVEKLRAEFKGDIARIEGKVDDQGAKQDRLLRLALIAEICRIHWLRMDASGELLRQLNDSFERLQAEHEALTRSSQDPFGRRYNPLECGPQR